MKTYVSVFISRDQRRQYNQQNRIYFIDLLTRYAQMPFQPFQLDIVLWMNQGDQINSNEPLWIGATTKWMRVFLKHWKHYFLMNACSMDGQFLSNCLPIQKWFGPLQTNSIQCQLMKANYKQALTYTESCKFLAYISFKDSFKIFSFVLKSDLFQVSSDIIFTDWMEFALLLIYCV